MMILEFGRETNSKGFTIEIYYNGTKSKKDVLKYEIFNSHTRKNLFFDNNYIN